MSKQNPDEPIDFNLSALIRYRAIIVKTLCILKETFNTDQISLDQTALMIHMMNRLSLQMRHEPFIDGNATLYFNENADSHPGYGFRYYHDSLLILICGLWGKDSSPLETIKDDYGRFKAFSLADTDAGWVNLCLGHLSHADCTIIESVAVNCFRVRDTESFVFSQLSETHALTRNGVITLSDLIRSVGLNRDIEKEIEIEVQDRTTINQLFDSL